jgi:hypothetical protein
VVVNQTQGQRGARDHDRGEEYRVQQDQERQQGATRRRRLEPGTAQRIQRQRGAARSGGRKQPSRRRTCERDLSAFARADAIGRSPGNKREQRHVAGQRDALERDPQDHPDGADAESAAQRVGEHVDAASQEDDAEYRGCRKQHRKREPARQATEVDRGECGLWSGDFGCEHVDAIGGT